MSLGKSRKLETLNWAKIIRLLWIFLALGKDSLMKPLTIWLWMKSEQRRMQSWTNHSTWGLVSRYLTTWRQPTCCWLRRTYPEIVDGSHSRPIFIQETFLPPYTIGVDPDNFERQLQKLYDVKDEKLLKSELATFHGSFAERKFYDEQNNVLKGKLLFSKVLWS